MLKDAPTKFPAAAQLFGGYFHQDWKADAKTPDDAVRLFVSHQSEQTKKAAAREIETILKEFPEESELEELLDSFGNSYDAGRSEKSYRDWLTRILGVLRFSANRK
jgi:hypothetical protein